jgi:hypothetical protein
MEGNIKMDFTEIRCEGMDWINLLEDRDRWQALMNTVMITKMAVSWNAVPCSLVEIGRRFRDAHCLHHQDDIATSQKTATFILVRT